MKLRKLIVRKIFHDVYVYYFFLKIYLMALRSLRERERERECVRIRKKERAILILNRITFVKFEDERDIIV